MTGGATAAAAEHIEDIAKIEAAEAAEIAIAAAAVVMAAATATGCVCVGGVAEAVVVGLFIGIAQDFIRFVDFFHFCFGIGIVFIDIGMTFPRFFAIGFFDFIGAGTLFNA